MGISKRIFFAAVVVVVVQNAIEGTAFGDSNTTPSNAERSWQLTPVKTISVPLLDVSRALNTDFNLKVLLSAIGQPQRNKEKKRKLETIFSNPDLGFAGIKITF